MKLASVTTPGGRATFGLAVERAGRRGLIDLAEWAAKQTCAAALPASARRPGARVDALTGGAADDAIDDVALPPVIPESGPAAPPSSPRPPASR